MIIISTQNSFDWSQATVYKFGEENVLLQTPSRFLQKFLVDEAPVELVVEASMAVQEFLDRSPEQQATKIHYQGDAPFGDRLREVTYRRKKQFAALELDGELVCEIDFNHNHIHLVRDGGFANMVNVELITGPALIIVMASLKTYCLHASAVATPQGNLVFVGESGVGKSTLAWQAGEAWQQTADDIIPVIYEKGRSGVRLSANFPQLKLENAKAPGVVTSDANIDYIFRIRPEPSKTIEFKKLSKAEGMLQFVRHTVGAKLFDMAMMKRHTKFANYVVNKVIFIELAYPRDLLGLTDLREEILEYLKTI